MLPETGYHPYSSSADSHHIQYNFLTEALNKILSRIQYILPLAHVCGKVCLFRMGWESPHVMVHMEFSSPTRRDPRPVQTFSSACNHSRWGTPGLAQICSLEDTLSPPSPIQLGHNYSGAVGKRAVAFD